MKFLIIGRSGSGKDALRTNLEKLGLTFVKSTTTRKPRFEGEDTHFFVTQETGEKEIKSAVATTEINGNLYYATRDTVENSDAYIIDPKGMYELTEKMPDTAFRIVYIESDPDDRKMMALKRCDNDDSVQEYDSRCKSEDKMFKDFEEAIEDINNLPPNIMSIYRIVNDYKPQSLENAAFGLLSDFTKHNNLESMIAEAIAKKLLAGIEIEGNICKRSDNEETSLDLLTETVCLDFNIFGRFMESYFSNTLDLLPTLNNKINQITIL